MCVLDISPYAFFFPIFVLFSQLFSLSGIHLAKILSTWSAWWPHFHFPRAIWNGIWEASCIPPLTPEVCNSCFYAPISVWNNCIIIISLMIWGPSLWKCSDHECTSIYKLWSGCRKPLKVEREVLRLLGNSSRGFFELLMTNTWLILGSMSTSVSFYGKFQGLLLGETDSKSHGSPRGLPWGSGQGCIWRDSKSSGVLDMTIDFGRYWFLELTRARIKLWRKLSRW